MKRTEHFQCPAVYGRRLGWRETANNIQDKTVFLNFSFSKDVLLLGGHCERLMDKTTSFTLGLQSLMGRCPSDLQTRLLGLMNQTRPYGHRFSRYAPFISESVIHNVSMLGPEDSGLEVWVELEMVIVHSRDHDRTGEELETVRYDRSGADEEEEEEEVCPVCLQNFVVGEEIKSTPCGHRFHEECIFRWMESSRTCPMCRSSVRRAKKVVWLMVY
ncbi:NEP1-interacting protein-like 1 [Acorus gramineus]|uniref:NEP1-interacting protein-like 1 n=1 Tax=Acorus gramineus TaxID=55184 RepID=A0AAV9BQH5_ACOGR|nr:NEP1-interacting protein-like 1 [Acorus gramineus]